jgi:leucine dehydrogenase
VSRQTPAPITDHECVTVINDPRSGLRAVIAIHSTRLGPALGGCRALAYATMDDALSDALKLSAAMTLKGAAAGLPFGGGKMTIILPPDGRLTPPLLAAAGEAIDMFGGRYVTGEDVGTDPDIMTEMARATDHVLGLPVEQGGSGDPSPSTALGCWHGIETAVRTRLGARDLRGARVAVQGLGNVGMRLCALLFERGADLIVSDTDPVRVEQARRRFGAETASPSAIHAVKADVYAPCALGGVISARSVGEIAAPVVAGAANNQLAGPEAAVMLAERGVLYAPDFVINAGGMMQLAGERAGWAAETLAARIHTISRTLAKVFERASAERIDTDTAARAIALDRLNAHEQEL